jgi:F-type H+-transporting ATPase subunit b
MFSKLIFRPGLFSALKATDFQNRAATVLVRCYSSGHADHAKHPVASSSNEPTIAEQLEYWDKANKIYFGPERDLVNFPIKKQPMDPPPVRLGCIPETWFQQLYEKTGVTGPYVFGVGFITYLLSKEIWIVEHQFGHFISFWLAFYYVNRKWGGKIGAFLDRTSDQIEDRLWTKPIKKTKDDCHKVIGALEKTIWQEEGQKYIFEAKRENVDLQLESIYRQRLAEVHQNVKKRLDYHLQVESLQKNVQQQHMVNWIVDNVVKSITPQQEKESLSKCIQDLKNLAAKAATA